MPKNAASDFGDDFNKVVDEEIKKHPRPTILVCGYTGVGKSSLIRAILGPEVVPEREIAHGKPGTMEFTRYSDQFITLWDSRGFEPAMSEDGYVRSAEDFVRGRQRHPDFGEHVHLVWYCVQGCGARVTPTDIALIKRVFPSECTLVVVTKNDITRANQRTAVTAALTEAKVAADRIVPTAENDPGSLQLLVSKSLELLPTAYRHAFRAKQVVDLDQKKLKLRSLLPAPLLRQRRPGA